MTGTDGPFAFGRSTIRIGDGPEIPIAGGTFTFNRDGVDRESYALAAGALDFEGSFDVAIDPEQWTAFADASQDVAESMRRFGDAMAQQMEQVRQYLNANLPAVLASAGYRFPRAADPEPGIGPEDFAITPRMVAALAEADRRADEPEAARQTQREDRTDYGAPLEASDADWTARGNVCAHVCGGNADHVCDARATTTLRYTLPSGGTRTMPICRACHAAETKVDATIGDPDQHVITVRPETGNATWHSLTRPPTEPGMAFRPACSCGWEAPLTHDTEEGAQRAAEAHAAISVPPRVGRYVFATEDDGTDHLECAECSEILLRPVSYSGRGVRSMREAVVAHDRSQHPDEPEIAYA